MKNKHIHSAADQSLFQLLLRHINDKVIFNEGRLRVFVLTKFIVYMLLLSAFYTLIYVAENSWVFIISFILYGIFTMLFALNFSHDLSHNTVFQNKNLNNFFFTISFTMIGAHAKAWKHRHNHEHHHAPNVEGFDPDLRLSNVIRVTPQSAYRWHHRFQHLYAPFMYSLYSFFWLFIKDIKILYSTGGYNWRDHVSFWIQKIMYFVYLLVLPCLYSKQQVSVILLAFVIMHLVQSVFLLFSFLITHHVEKTAYPALLENGKIDASWVMNQICSSNDFYPFSKTANFIFGGFNCHIAHHLFPHIHHMYYPEINKVLYSIFEQHNITPNQTGYWTGIVSHLKHLKKMSNGYIHINYSLDKFQSTNIKV